MKIRNGFVSNSSSSSFYIPKKDLTPVQIFLIKNHMEIHDIFKSRVPEALYSQYVKEFNDYDSWKIEEDEENIIGKTSMTNFSMGSFLELIDVDRNSIKWESY